VSDFLHPVYLIFQTVLL